MMAAAWDGRRGSGIRHHQVYRIETARVNDPRRDRDGATDSPSDGWSEVSLCHEALEVSVTCELE